MAGRNTNNRSPRVCLLKSRLFVYTYGCTSQDMFFLNTIQQGFYGEQFLDIPEDEFRKFERELAADLDPQLNHKPIKVPRAVNPFKDIPSGEKLFNRHLDKLAQEAYIPPGWGFFQGENRPWHDDEIVEVQKKQVCVTLPENPWKARAIIWVRSLEILQQELLQLQVDVDII